MIRDEFDEIVKALPAPAPTTCFYGCGNPADAQVRQGYDALTGEQVMIDVCTACAINPPKDTPTVSVKQAYRSCGCWICAEIADAEEGAPF